MPRLPPVRPTAETLKIGPWHIPVQRSGCVVVGSGAAGLRAAVELRRRNADVLILSQSAFGGTSACSGSDKQTLHTANTAGRGDNYFAMARAIRAGGAMDEDTAYVEALGSPRAMASLQYLGLPLPQDRLGGTLRYQTDHDETGRATSCGPRTSRLMVKVLAQEALRLGIPLHNHTTAIKILTRALDGQRRVCGVLAMRPRDSAAGNPLGLILYPCSALVMAAGGPGELYRDSVYPNGCFGSLGLALDAGIEVVNLTESQFGIGTRREGFPWNLSGTYVQAMPHIFSRDSSGAEHHFLADYFRTTRELASNIFRKGYQWPFHTTRMLDFGSSLLDLAVFREQQAGRRVFMDFNRNPVAIPGDAAFDLERLDDDVKAYLGSAGAVQHLPIGRLAHMNPLSIELYRRYKIDIAVAPLEFAVNNQHMNGGIAVDVWGQSSLAGCYAVGEAAGTHGVTRPGGAALNAGQVFGTRAAEHIAATAAAVPRQDDLSTPLAAAVAEIAATLRPGSPLTVKAIRANVQARMSDKAGFICTAAGVRQARDEAEALNARIGAEGISHARPAEAVRALQWRHMALASEAVITALDFYIAQGGGSRGGRAICDPSGTRSPETRRGPLTAYRVKEENVRHRAEQIVLRWENGRFLISTRPNRTLDEGTGPFFERDWPDWLTGQVFAPAGT
jgi:succinate dehydrogenase/fumarate reductase flavoprotein subunit